MAKPEIVELTSGTWLKVAGNITSCYLQKLKGAGAFIYTYRQSGEVPPADTDLGEGIGVFLNGEIIKEISSLSEIDVYIWYKPAENDTGYVRYDSSIGSVLNSILSTSQTGIISTTYEDDEREKGHERIAENIITALPTGLSYFVFDPTLIIDRTVKILPSSYKVSDGIVTVTFYKGTNYTGTVEASNYNPNFTSDFVHHATLKSGATGTVLGDYINKISAGSDTFFLLSGAGTEASSKPFTIDTSVKYLVVVDNQSGGAVQADYTFPWFEIPV